VQRKVLEPNDFESVGEVARTLNAFEHHWSSVAQPLDWHFTRQDLEKLMQRLSDDPPPGSCSKVLDVDPTRSLA